MQFTYSDGATPLDHEAKQGLIPPLTTQEQLNAFEQTNITLALEWAIKSRKLRSSLVSVEGLKLFHKKMFSQTWNWAGEFRRQDLNIGIEWAMIPEQVRVLCDDVRYWEDNKVFDLIEIAVRFHHRLVYVHPFPNGNGRLSRLTADFFLQYRKHERLSWGKGANLADDSPDRREYIAGLREADGGDPARLIRFATR